MLRPLKRTTEIVVLGGGIAGLSAAREAAQLGRGVTLLEPSVIYGGLIATIGRIDGLLVRGVISGQEMVTHLMTQCADLGVVFKEAVVTELLRRDGTLHIKCASGESIAARAVVVSTGARLRPLGVPGETEFAGRGVSRCATCDGGFFRGQDVVVVGGGDSACQQAITLADTSRKVIVVGRSRMRARREYIERLAALKNVEFVWEAVVERIFGNAGVEGVTLHELRSGRRIDMPCAGVFPFPGTLPNAEFVSSDLRDDQGRIVCDARGQTPEPGVFAAGAVRAGNGGHLLHAAAEGIATAQAAHHLLNVSTIS